jgi:Family of unknown function (DUF6655)
MTCSLVDRTAWTALAAAIAVLTLVGCGTTRSTDSLRTATEQLLISDAIDRAVQTIDFKPLAGQTVYLDDARLEEVVDRDYLVSTLRQHLLASGCDLMDVRDAADFIVEARAGAVGTDRNDLLFGIPATNVPQILPLQGVPAAIPEVPLAKRRDQRGVAKVSMFAYHRATGRPVWQSGIAARESSSNDVWLFGAGPFQYGSVLRSAVRSAKPHHGGEKVALNEQVVFASPEKLAKEFRRLPAASEVAAAKTQAAKTPAAEQTTVPKVAAEVASAAPYRSTGGNASSLLPNFAEAIKPKQVVPRLTGRITGAELLRNAAPKTAELSLPPRDVDPMSLPIPRFDSL